MVSFRPLGLFRFQMAFSWPMNGDDPNHLLTGMILQVSVFSSSFTTLTIFFYKNHVAILILQGGPKIQL